MEVRNCRGCGRLYNYIGGSYKNLCPLCINELENKFEEVKEYIEQHKNATMPVISAECGVKIDQIERWVREERLFFADDSPIGIACENCGITIKSGRFCPACKSKMTNEFSQLYPSSGGSAMEKRKSRTDGTKGVTFEGGRIKHI